MSILQQSLIDLGYTMPRSTQGGTSLPDGIFGVETERVVKKFQQDHVLQPDGEAGRLTLKQLEVLLIADHIRRDMQRRAEIMISAPIG